MRKLRVMLPIAVAVTCLFVFTGAALAVQSPASDTPAPTAPTRSPLLIVELDAPPLAAVYKTQLRAATGDGKLDVQSADAQAYVAQLQAEQAAFVRQLQSEFPGATVSQFIDESGARQNSTYQVVFNGMAINPGAGLSAAEHDAVRMRIARLPGVKGVYPDMPHYTDLYTSTALINAPVVWDALGGRAMAGAGVKFASMDGGVHHLSPMFDGSGYTYPNGFGPNGKGFTDNNNGKIITSRAYFRSWDPPQTADPGLSGCGDACAWPGPKGTSHGVHTASTAAGGIITDVVYAAYPVGTMSGVAPHAYVMSYKVFYGSVSKISSFYDAEGIAALEDIAIDGADVLNNSWGGGPYSSGLFGNPLETALANTAASGVFIAMSAGNDGPSNSTADHPLPDYINVAATTTSGTLASGIFDIVGHPDLQNIPFSGAGFGGPLPYGHVVTYTVLPSASVDPKNVLGCVAWPAGTFTGKAALIRRGDCDFSLKVFNAQIAGAEFVIVYNKVEGGDELMEMGPGEHADEVTIPSIFIGHTNGEAIVDAYVAAPPVEAVLNAIAFQVGNIADRVASFSSRGPAVGPALVPDIAAPGVNILAQGYTPGARGEAQYFGYGQASGTSMAAPHVAGAAVLVREAYPNWSNAAIKSALMSTSKYTDVYNFDGTPAQPLDMGAGRLDLMHVLAPGVVLDPPKVSFGAVMSGTVKSVVVRVTSVASVNDTYHVSTLYTGMGFTQTTELPGITVTPAEITLAPGESKEITVTVDPIASQGVGENQGYIVLDGAVFDAHMPVWARVLPALQAADVLIIDSDASDLVPVFSDYLRVYTRTLKALHKTYEVVNTANYFGENTTIPDPAQLAGYGAVLWYTGDNYVPELGLTPQDQYSLLDYLNNGGTVIAMGQDLAATIDAAPGSEFNWLYGWGLGATWLQDSVSAYDEPDAFIRNVSSLPPVFRNIIIYLVEQYYVDEITNTADSDGRGSVAVLNYGGPYNVKNGTVAVAHRDQPLLESPGLPFTGRAFYASFGLEGMAVGSNGIITLTTPTELLGGVFAWAESEPGTASIGSSTPATTTAVTLFTASYAANAQAASPAAAIPAIAWRWDFGDGSLWEYSETAEAGHRYICKESNVYTVRVQITDAMGNNAIASQEVDVTDSCFQEPETIQNFFLPWIRKD